MVVLCVVFYRIGSAASIPFWSDGCLCTAEATAAAAPSFNVSRMNISIAHRAHEQMFDKFFLLYFISLLCWFRRGDYLKW